MIREPEETNHPVYNFEEGDIVLITLDRVKFRVHSFMLKAASSFFRQMLEVPRIASEGIEDPIPLTEPSDTISFLLDLMYPIGPVFPTLTDYIFAWKVTTAADNACPHEDSLELYALACRWKWSALKLKAIRATLDLDFRPREVHKTLQKLDAVDLYILLKSRWDRVEALSDAFDIDSFDLDAADQTDVCLSVWRDTWSCTCENYDEYSGPPEFRENAKALHLIVMSNLHVHPLGTALRSVGYWNDLPLPKLWQLRCDNCGELFIDKGKFVLNVREILGNEIFFEQVCDF